MGHHRGALHIICNLNDSVLKKLSYHFIMDLTIIIILLYEVEEELKKQFTCIGENTKKYINFTGSVEKEIAIIY